MIAKLILWCTLLFSVHILIWLIIFIYLVPRLSVNNQLLTQNSYPLLVGLLYWIRSVCKYRFSLSPEKLKIPSHCLPSQSVDVIWCGCVNYLLRISKSIQEPLTYKKVYFLYIYIYIYMSRSFIPFFVINTSS